MNPYHDIHRSGCPGEAGADLASSSPICCELCDEPMTLNDPYDQHSGWRCERCQAVQEAMENDQFNPQ